MKRQKNKAPIGERICSALALVSLIATFAFVGCMESGSLGLLPGFIGAMVAVASFGINSYFGGLMYDSPNRYKR